MAHDSPSTHPVSNGSMSIGERIRNVERDLQILNQNKADRERIQDLERTMHEKADKEPVEKEQEEIKEELRPLKDPARVCMAHASMQGTVSLLLKLAILGICGILGIGGGVVWSYAKMDSSVQQAVQATHEIKSALTNFQVSHLKETGYALPAAALDPSDPPVSKPSN